MAISAVSYWHQLVWEIRQGVVGVAEKEHPGWQIDAQDGPVGEVKRGRFTR